MSGSFFMVESVVTRTVIGFFSTSAAYFAGKMLLTRVSTLAIDP